MIIREPIAAGSYYSLEKGKLIKEIEFSFFGEDGPKEIREEKIAGVISPHIEYIYGYFYAWSYFRIKKSNFLILGVNHLRTGSSFSIAKKGIWKTPLGEILIDEKNADEIVKKIEFLDFDILSHNNEYSIEVQLPFLQYKFKNEFKFIPILIKSDHEDLFDQSRFLGEVLGKFLKKNEDWALIATSNFSALPKKLAEETDDYLISSILKLNEEEFFEKIKETNSGVCGYYPIISLICAMKELKIKNTSLLKYSAVEGIHPDPLKAIGCASIIFI